MNNGGGVNLVMGSFIFIFCYLNLDIVQVLEEKSVISVMLGLFRILQLVLIMRYRLESFHTMKDQTVFPVVNASTIGSEFSKIYKLIPHLELRRQRR